MTASAVSSSWDVTNQSGSTVAATWSGHVLFYCPYCHTTVITGFLIQKSSLDLNLSEATLVLL